MTLASDILSSKYPSPTKFVGNATPSAGLTYTPDTPVDVFLTLSNGTGGGGTMNINGAIINVGAGNTLSMRMSLGAGQTLTIPTLSTSGQYVSVSSKRSE